MVIAAPVLAESLAVPGRTEAFVDAFLEDTSIAVEWDPDEAVWRTAGRAFQRYAERRRKQRDSGTRRVLADFMIGAHAKTRGYRLLTLDEQLYRPAFPKLIIEAVWRFEAPPCELIQFRRSRLLHPLSVPKQFVR